MRTKIIRTGVIAGEEPGFHKDAVTGEWSGSQLSFVRNIASTLGCQLELLETTYGNSVLDLQANKIDLALALQATPARSMVINFTRPIYYTQLVAILRKGVEAKTWSDINKSTVRIAVGTSSPERPFTGVGRSARTNDRPSPLLSSVVAGLVPAIRHGRVPPHTNPR